jgi:hypothetical protein
VPWRACANDQPVLAEDIFWKATGRKLPTVRKPPPNARRRLRTSFDEELSAFNEEKAFRRKVLDVL